MDDQFQVHQITLEVIVLNANDKYNLTNCFRALGDSAPIVNMLSSLYILVCLFSQGKPVQNCVNWGDFRVSNMLQT